MVVRHWSRGLACERHSRRERLTSVARSRTGGAIQGEYGGGRGTGGGGGGGEGGLGGWASAGRQHARASTASSESEAALLGIFVRSARRK